MNNLEELGGTQNVTLDFLASYVIMVVRPPCVLDMPERRVENENGYHYGNRVGSCGGRPGLAEKRRCTRSFSRTGGHDQAWSGVSRRGQAI